jgi:hypothetical protein
MPVQRGSWSRAIIFSPPRIESICPYGHGTLDEPELHIGGFRPPEWTEHEDMWKELEGIKPER